LKPVDEAYFLSVASPYKAAVFVEDGAVAGGIGRYLEHVLQTAPGTRRAATKTLGFPDRFLAQGRRAEILEDAGLSPSAIADAAKSLF
jgi:1-deoxy-D-xylulose-5-phosphate synthase